jgi:esterase/lipase superfamily enzyme
MPRWSSITTGADKIMPGSLEQPSVIISHSVRDQPLVEAFEEMLQAGFGLLSERLFDSHAIDELLIPGDDFVRYVRTRIKDAKLAIFFVSKQFFNSALALVKFGAVLSRTIEQLILLVPPLRHQDLPYFLHGINSAAIINEIELDKVTARIAGILGLTSVFHTRLNTEGFRSARRNVLERAFAASERERQSIALEERVVMSYESPAGGVGARRPAYESACIYPVWYGTNREPANKGDSIFSSKRSSGSALYYGKCDIVIPRSHAIGSIGSSWWNRLISGEDDRLKISGYTRLSETAFWETTRERLVQLAENERTALIFIHGYNVHFRSAAIRAAQLGADLKVPLTAFFSWPSQGSLSGYAADAAAIDASEHLICKFLEQFLQRGGAERVHLIVHSLGNRGLLRSFQELAQRAATGSRVRFGQIFLAAPDVDAEVFARLAAAYTQMAQRTTLYASSNDKALAGSGIIYGAPRAGYAPPITIVPGIDTVEVSAIDLSKLGHGYFGAARSFLSDIYALMQSDQPPAKRIGLIEWQGISGTYWRIQ